MVYQSIEQRTSSLRKRLDQTTFSIEVQGKRYRLVGGDGKPITRSFQVGGETHRTIAKLFPDRIPPVEGYVVKPSGRVVKTSVSNLVRSIPARELVPQFSDLGIKTKKDLVAMAKIARPSSIQELRRFVKSVRSAQKIGSSKTVLERFEKSDSHVSVALSHRALSGFRGYQESYEITYTPTTNYIDVWSRAAYPYLKRLLERFSHMRGSTPVKFQIVVKVGFKKVVMERDEQLIRSKVMTALQNPRDEINKALDRISENINKILLSGSGWYVESIKEAYLNVAQYTPTSGGSYIPLPKAIQNKKACINVRNEDENCFIYSVLAALHYDEIVKSNFQSRPQVFKKYIPLYPGIEELEMPMVIDFTSKVRKAEDVFKSSITVLRCVAGEDCDDTHKILPFRSGSAKYTREIVLMLTTDGEKSHFVWVKSLSALLCNEVKSMKHTQHWCTRCLSRFGKNELLQEHKKVCQGYEECGAVVKLPKPGTTMKFSAVKKQLEIPFIVYGDFEALLVKNKDVTTKSTLVQNLHVPCGAYYVIVSRVHGGEVIKKSSYTQEDCVSRLLGDLQRDCHELYMEYMHNQKPMDDLTAEEKILFEIADRCHICGEGFVESGEKKDQRVRDHCHFTGKFRGAAHSSCNVQYQVSKVFPVLFHNLRGYDSRFIIKELKSIKGSSEAYCIPTNREKFLTFSLRVKSGEYGKQSYEIRFVDSAAFMSYSLEQLASTLQVTDFKRTLEFVKGTVSENGMSGCLKIINRLGLLLGKGSYPYEYMDSWERFSETALPPSEAFISLLSTECQFERELTKKQLGEHKSRVEHAHSVWNAFGCKTMRDFHDTYLAGDVYQLADIFEKFRTEQLALYNTDPAHYFGLPGFAWDAMLKKTGVELPLLSEDPEDLSSSQRAIYEFWEESCIGGISATGGLRHVKANNKYLQDYDSSKPSTYIVYIDANALYGSSLSRKLACSDFSFINPLEFDLEAELNRVDGEWGHFLEVDVMLPAEYHDLQNCYPCFPTKRVVSRDELSSTQHDMIEAQRRSGREPSQGQEKVVLDLHPKTNYKLDIRLLKVYLECGWVVTKISRVLRFRQSTWMKPYIDQCAELRKAASSRGDAFGKQLNKDMGNIVFGKSVENVRKRENVKISMVDRNIKKMINSPFIKALPEPLNDHGLAMIDMFPEEIKLNKPVYAGACVLSLSKIVMYEMFYKVLKPKYGDKVRMIYTDTDSFILQIETDDVYQDIADDSALRERFDTSEFPRNHPLYSTENQGKYGCFKDEMKGEPIREVFAIRAKCYSVFGEYETHKNTGKGTKKAVLKKTEHFKYAEAMYGDTPQSEWMTCIRSHKHEMYTQTCLKQTLSMFDDKKWIHPDKKTQTSFGHWRLNMQELPTTLLENGA